MNLSAALALTGAVSGSKRGAAFGCSIRGFSDEGDAPIETAVCSVAAFASTLVLHFGQRMVKGLDGILISSTCRRDEHFGQTIIIVVVSGQVGLFDHAQHRARVGHAGHRNARTTFQELFRGSNAL